MGRHKAKLTSEQVQELRRRTDEGETVRALAHAYGVDSSTVSRAVRGITWGEHPRMTAAQREGWLRSHNATVTFYVNRGRKEVAIWLPVPALASHGTSLQRAIEDALEHLAQAEEETRHES